jgi:hypothetical protein
MMLGGGRGGRAGAFTDQQELAREIQSVARASEAAEELRRCPKCGHEEFSQRPFRS